MKIETIEQLRSIISEPTVQARHKIHRQLNARAKEFIQRSPMVLVATADRDAQPTVSPKGDVQGFVRILDDSTLLVPERPGNRLIFSLQNILVNPRVGLIFLLPGTCETLRVGGTASLLDDADLCSSFAARGKPALLVTRVDVTECYFHCSKAFLRSALWNPDAWPERMTISFGEEIAEEGGLGEVTVAEFDAGVQRRYKTDL
jgi:PPOX class probable FMN-dependent enzyme